MSMESQLTTRLAGFTALTDLVGARIYQDEAPQNTAAPYLVWSRIDDGRPPSMGPTYGLTQARVQSDAWAESTAAKSGPLARREVLDQVKAALDGWSTSSGTIVQGTLYLGAGPNFRDEESGLFKGSVDYEINYEE